MEKLGAEAHAWAGSQGSLTSQPGLIVKPGAMKDSVSKGKGDGPEEPGLKLTSDLHVPPHPQYTCTKKKKDRGKSAQPWLQTDAVRIVRGSLPG